MDLGRVDSVLEGRVRLELVHLLLAIVNSVEYAVPIII